MALGLPGGGWDVVVMARFHPPSLPDSRDVLGRRLPAWERLEVRDGLRQADCLRLANQLKGMKLPDRYALFRRLAPGLRLSHAYRPDDAAFG
ncbi:MAG: hypothetical protein DI568_05835 [Sphingomonas sp.]|nr:MAG: hypothetical protein DI568_05835 [Sphingomonas sp.]